MHAFTNPAANNPDFGLSTARPLNSAAIDLWSTSWQSFLISHLIVSNDARTTDDLISN